MAKCEPANDNSVSAKKSRASKSGSHGEKVVLEAAALSGAARLTKIPTPTVYIPGRGISYNKKKSITDFAGHMLDGTARYIALEAKRNSSKASFSMAEVEPWQRAHMDVTLAGGGLAVLVVVYTKDDLLCQFAWEDVRGFATLTKEQLLAAVVPKEKFLRGFMAARLTVVSEGKHVAIDGPFGVPGMLTR